MSNMSANNANNTNSNTTTLLQSEDFPALGQSPEGLGNKGRKRLVKAAEATANNPPPAQNNDMMIDLTGDTDEEVPKKVFKWAAKNKRMKQGE